MRTRPGCPFWVAVSVINKFFEQGLRRTLGDTAVNLSFEQQRVQHGAGIVAGNLLEVRNFASFGVDFDNGNMRTERKRGTTRAKSVCIGEPTVIGP